MKQFIADHFSTLVVVFVFVLLFSVYTYEVHCTRQPTNTLDWLEGEMKEVVGAILMGLTGKGVAAVIGGTRASDPKPAEPAKP